MNPKRWQQLDQLLDAALERPPAERAAFLAEACAGDESLRQQMESLLRSDEAVENFIEAPAFELAAELLTETQAQSLLGQQLGHYKILARLGAGGMGEVYRARDTRLGREVAIKVLPAKFSQDADRLRRFEQEARAASVLNQPNILTIYDIGTHANMPYIVTELLDGAELRAQLSTGALPVRRVLDYAQQIAAGLAAAHEKGVVHRDLKPENLFVTKDGRIKILDFGLAKLKPQHFGQGVDSEAPTLKPLTDPGVVMGTVGYMSPEQVRGQEADHRSDIFSFGLILYEMLAGRQAFHGESFAETMAAIVKEEPPNLLETNSKVPPQLERLVRRCLEKKPEQRFQTANDLGFALESLAGAADASQPAAAVTSAPAAAVISAPAKWRRPFMLAGFGSALLVVASGLGLWFSRATHKEPPATLPPARISLLTSYPGSEREPAFSPDGNRIAFIWDGGSEHDPDATDIYVKLLGVTDPMRLTSDPASDHRPVWSPDGNYVAFLRRQLREVETLIVVPYIGGKEQQIAQVADGLDWSPDGDWFAVVRPGEPDGYPSIYLLNKDTKESKRITLPEEGAMRDVAPAFSPDGKTLAFIRYVSSAVTDIFTVPVSGGSLKRLTFDARNVLNLCWTPDGRHLIFTSNRSGRNSLWKIAAAGGAPEQITVIAGDVIDLAVARQGSRLAYTQESSDTSIYLTDIPANLAGAKNRKWTKFIFSAQSEHSPQFSRDGQQIAFVSRRSGSPEIWICDGDGQHPVQLTRFNGPQTGSPRWSPNGQEIVFDSRPEGQADIFVVSAQGGKPRQLTADKALDVTPSWSADGQWIYFSSNRSGERQIWKVPAAGGQATQVTKKGGFEPVESPDGQFIIYAKGRDIPGIWRIPVAGGEEEAIPELATAGYHRYWSVTSAGIFFVPQEVRPRPVINFYSFATRKVTLAALPTKPPIYGPSGMSVSPDGRRLLYTQPTQIVSDISLVENFR